MSISEFVSHSEEETRRLAAEFAATLKGSEKLSLIGPLGSGKTTFVRGFVQPFGVKSAEVQSPTFTLVREYRGSRKIYHVDLYRLDKEEDIFEAGIYELIGSDELVLIEWADHLKKYYPQDSIKIEFAHVESGARRITITNSAGREP